MRRLINSIAKARPTTRGSGYRKNAAYLLYAREQAQSTRADYVIPTRKHNARRVAQGVQMLSIHPNQNFTVNASKHTETTPPTAHGRPTTREHARTRAHDKS